MKDSWSLLEKLWKVSASENRPAHYIRYSDSFVEMPLLSIREIITLYCLCLTTVYKKGQRGKKEVSEQKRKDKERKVGSDNDKSREEEEEDEDHMEEEEPPEEEAEEEEVEN